jgi:hypothetical protein
MGKHMDNDDRRIAQPRRPRSTAARMTDPGIE